MFSDVAFDVNFWEREFAQVLNHIQGRRVLREINDLLQVSVLRCRKIHQHQLWLTCVHSLLFKQLVLVDSISSVSVAIISSIKFLVVSDVLVVKIVLPSMTSLVVVRNAFSAFILVVSYMTPVVLTPALVLTQLILKLFLELF